MLRQCNLVLISVNSSLYSGSVHCPHRAEAMAVRHFEVCLYHSLSIANLSLCQSASQTLRDVVPAKRGI